MLLPGWPLEVAGLMRLEGCAESMLSYIEPDKRKHLVHEATSIAKQLGEDTHNNVRLTLTQVLEELL